MKQKLSKTGIILLTSISFSCSVHDTSNYNFSQAEEIPEEIRHIENSRKDLKFSQKATGNFEISGKLLDFPRPFIYARDFKNGQKYFIEGISPDKEAFYSMWKYNRTKGWFFDRNQKLNFRIEFIYNDSFNFQALALVPGTKSKISQNFKLQLKEVVETSRKILNVSFLSQYSLVDNALLSKLIKEDRAVKSITDIRNSACAPTSVSMVNFYNNKNKKGNLNDEALHLYELFKTTNKPSGGTSWSNLLSVMKNQYGYSKSYYYGWPNFREYNTEDSKNRIFNIIIDSINSNKPLVFRSHSIPGYPAHYVAIIGYDKAKKTVIVNDPGSINGKNREFDFNTIAKLNAGIIVLN